MLRNNSILVFVAAALICGCAKKEESVSSQSDTSASEKAKLRQADALMLGSIDLSMQGDSAVSAAVATKGRRPEVRAFAAKMTGESHEMHLVTETAAARAGITPIDPVGDPTPGEVALTLSLINGATKNTDIDAIFLSGVASRNLALENVASYRRYATKDSGLSDFYEKIQATSHARVAAVKALVKKP